MESLAYAALIARFGERWYRSAGRLDSRGTALITVTGAVREQGVREIELGTTIGEIAADAGADAERVQAVVLGGYFGTWATVGDVWDLPLDPAVMRSRGLTFGCGIVGLLPTDVCGVSATAEIMAFMANESAGQCGPCLYGLRAIGDATTRVASGSAGAGRARRHRALDVADPRSRRVPSPGRRGPAHGQRAERLRRRVRPPRADRTLLDHRVADRGRLGWRPRLRVDWIRCDGYGLCGDFVPDLIELDDWRYPIIRPGPVDGARSTRPSGRSTAAR